MMKVDKALKIILGSIKPLSAEWADIRDSLGRTISRDIYSRYDLPMFNNSAMDGYAVRSKDTPGRLTIIEDIPAGYVAKKRITKGQAIKIMTGAPIPDGADSVVRVENTEEIGNMVQVFKKTKYRENVRIKGEDVKSGQVILPKGSVVRPFEMGMLASLGLSNVKVTKMPRVGILATGDELVGINERLTKGKIRSSNNYMIYGQVLLCSAVPVDLGIAKDTKGVIRKKILRGLDQDIDALVISGGISVGKYDFVKNVLLELGTKMKFWRVAMRPGKPLAFGIINGIPVFGLPGNPVSSTITFEEFARPAILKMQGSDRIFRPAVRAAITHDFNKRKGLRYFVRVKVENKDGKLYASCTGMQGSNIISSLVLADGIAVLPEEAVLIKKGQSVSVQLLRHGY